MQSVERVLAVKQCSFVKLREILFDRLFERERAYKPEAKRVKRELRPLERRESELDQEIDRLTDRDDDDPALTAAEEDRLRDLRREMETVRSRMRTLERQEEEIDPAALFRAHFEGNNPAAEVPELQGVGILTDGDQTRTVSAADYAGFVLYKRFSTASR